MKTKQRLRKYLRVTLIGLTVTAACFILGFFESIITKAPSLITSYGIMLAILWLIWRSVRLGFGMLMLYASKGKKF